jgi:hypothetical protein
MPSPKDMLVAVSEEYNAMEHVRAISREKAKTKEAELLLKSSEQKVMELEGAVAVYEKLREKDTRPIVIKKKAKAPVRKPPHTFLALASDWHSAETVDSSETGGRNEHNLEIGEERAHNYFRSLAKLIKEQQARFQIDDLVLWLGGDFMVGEIHGVESSRSCPLPPLEEVRHVKQILSNGIDFLLNELDIKKIHLPCNQGNHGRTTDRTRFRMGWAYSYEAYLYRDLANSYSDNPRLDWDVSDEHYKVSDIAGFRVLFHHGDNIRYASGVAGLVMPFRRKSLQLASTYSHDLFCIGHFHQYGAYSGTGMTNGSLVGWGSYAAGMGLPFEAPAQVTALIDHERRAVGRVMPIWV